MSRSKQAGIVLIAVLVALTSFNGLGGIAVAQDALSWGSVKANYQDEAGAVVSKEPAVMQHPIYGFGFTVAPGITGPLVDQICSVVAQTGIDLYALELVRFEFGPGPNQYLFAAREADGYLHGALVSLATNSVLAYVFSEVTPSGEDVVVYDGAGEELGRSVGEEVVVAPHEKAVEVSLCAVLVAVWEWGRDQWYASGQDPLTGVMLIVTGMLIIDLCG